LQQDPTEAIRREWHRRTRYWPYEERRPIARYFLKGKGGGERIIAILSGARHNFRLLLKWLRLLLCLILGTMLATIRVR
jgi:IS5 family transposase